MSPELAELRRLASRVPTRARVELGAAPDPEAVERLLCAVALHDAGHSRHPLRDALIELGARAVMSPLGSLVLGG